MKIGPFEFTEEDFRAVLNISGEAWKRLRVPKNGKNKIGIVVALKTEDDKDKKKLETEFITELNRYLADSGEEKKFHVYSFPDNLINKIDSQDDARELLIRSRGHLILHGSVVQRKIRSEDSYVFRLHGLIRHKPIRKIIQQQFIREFSELLPRKIEFVMKDEGIYFELTKDWIGYVIKYIVGIAAFVSGDVALADKLYHELKHEIDAIQKSNSVPVIQTIQDRLPRRILEVSMVYLARNYVSFIKSRKSDDLFKSEDTIREIKGIDPENYHARLQSSIIYFLKEDVDAAINELEDKDNNIDITWRYNLGFLYAYKGDVTRALENYKKTFHKIAYGNACLDSEIFISDVIKKEPSKIQLYFFRGVLNYKIKKDYELAREDFENFVKEKGFEKFPELRELTERYLSEIQLNLGTPLFLGHSIHKNNK